MPVYLQVYKQALVKIMRSNAMALTLWSSAEYCDGCQGIRDLPL